MAQLGRCVSSESLHPNALLHLHMQRHLRDRPWAPTPKYLTFTAQTLKQMLWGHKNDRDLGKRR